MPTPGEQKALLFLAAVALLGGGVRLLAAGSPDASPTPAEGAALARQLAASESAAAARRSARSAPKAKAPKKKAPEGAKGGKGANSGASRHAAAPAAPVDMDRATVEELVRLPGIGPALAERIVRERTRRGAFGSLAALDEVAGVGPALIKRLAPHVTFSAPPRPSSATGSGGGVRGSGRVVGLVGGIP